MMASAQPTLPPGVARYPTISNGAASALDPEKGLESKASEPLRNVPLGYSYIAAYADGHEVAPVFRRFGALKARVLYTQQAELEEKEETLARIDLQESLNADPVWDTDNMRWLEDRNKKRTDLIADIAKRLRRYEKDLILYRQIRQFPNAKKWQKENFRAILRNKEPICQEESGFIEKGDLVSIMKEVDDVSELSEWISDIRRSTFNNFGLKELLFRKKEKAVYEGSDEITLYSSKWMRIVGRTFFGALVGVVVTSGVVVLYYVKVDEWRLLVLGMSTLVCAILTAVFTTAKKGEVFAVAAAYCAVLVVFVGTVLERNSEVTLRLGDTWINGTVTG
ncbi:hypothetical protein TWF225_001670 [Orbilia oligospora]|uniref:Uncharacterized protein n=1 Tax=Orbilia oligospora TaxID=2813651 RepID=A0A7C8PF66_ORBOL|nr:hypothetical protein TWF225_001670 [Orbilia oligospora]KAF3165389.1 hypothetical protein TWF751_009170 [Orbilia oligospora]KAF3239824.1 hypothetical protein TWF128_011704 [Orbilia oligospora]KAF3248019.1 hypothetical protein TWF217_009476 [Orbilia oligospora]KAF3274478.1 hypothetical protein TWF132_003531 [Orbilia oligospora]